MDALPPDPYAALGVAKDATTAAIKSQYRKLVLKFHPDKVQDDALKQAAADDFHKVQTAYEIVGDEDRRQRYDAQCRLTELRKTAMERGGRGGPDVRTASFKVPTDSGDFFARGPERSGGMSPRYEERRPHYAEDYFSTPRPMSRKDSEFDRASKRTSPREDSKNKSKTSTKKAKENERSSRDERARRSEQDRGKERDRKEDRKYAFVSEHSPNGDSDDYERARRQKREEDEARKARATWEEDRRREEEAAANFFGNERTQKMFNQDYIAREYMSKGNNPPPLERTTSERRPSPVRKSSSREKVEYIKREGGKSPVMIRRGSGRPELTRDSRMSSSREKDIDIVEEPEEIPRRQPPPLTKMQSSPANIRPPFERQRSSSLQFDPKDVPPPNIGIKRAETMPYPPTGANYGESRRKDPSKLRTEIPHGLPTPEQSPEPPSTRKTSYGQIYADDNEYPTPDGYRTEFREPSSKARYERSPSPIREPRERQRSTTTKHSQPPAPKRTTSTTYSYPMPTEPTDPNGRRPSLQRESSSRNGPLFGEVPTTTRSPAPTTRAKYPPPNDVQYSKPNKIEEVRMASGHNRRDRDRPRTGRQGMPVY